jgi:AraC family transcriptional regulator of adaptative response/methylated-DNA-[protein]-cysteine methyltransferase
MPPRERHQVLVVEACRRIEQAEREPSARELAESAGLSPYHFGRVFKAIMGITPKQYAMAHRARVAAQNLQCSKNVTSAIYESGYGASSRFYESAKHRHGMTAQDIRKGGNGIEVHYAFADSSLGLVVIAATSKGICAVLFGASENELAAELRGRFPNAVFQEADGGSDFEQWVERTVDCIDGGAPGFDIPLDVYGTAFQELVWRALREIPKGQTASYSEVAARIGRPKAARALASACAANPVAVIIPCHRVVRTDGGLSNYFWGANKKRRLLERESSAQ